MSWQIKYFNDAIQNQILSLPSGLLGRYLHCTDKMIIYGPDLGMPHTKAMRQGLFELRLKSKEGISRVFFCTFMNNRIIMLHQFIKKTDKTPLKDLAIAHARMKEWKNANA